MHHAIQAVLKQAVRPGTRAVFNEVTFNQLLPELRKLDGAVSHNQVVVNGVAFVCCDSDLSPGFVSLRDSEGQAYQLIPVDIPTSSAL